MNTSTPAPTTSATPSIASAERPAEPRDDAPPIEVATAFYAAFLGDDLAAAAALIAPDAVLHVPGTQPRAGDHVGLGAILEFVLANEAAVGSGSVRTEVLDITGGATYASVLCLVRAERPERVALANRTVHLLRIADGRIAEIWFHNWDQPSVDAFWS